MLPARHRMAVILACLLVLPGDRAPACCPAWRRGEPVRIADQQILVVWDPETRMEHFIREAKFAAAPGARQEGFQAASQQKQGGVAGVVAHHVEQRSRIPNIVSLAELVPKVEGDIAHQKRA